MSNKYTNINMRSSKGTYAYTHQVVGKGFKSLDKAQEHADAHLVPAVVVRWLLGRGLYEVMSPSYAAGFAATQVELVYQNFPAVAAEHKAARDAQAAADADDLWGAGAGARLLAGR